MFDIKQVDIPKKKSSICDTILHSLPSWFGIEDSIIEYADNVQYMPFWAAFDEEKPIGFAALKVHNPYTSEVYVMGILQDFHRHGIGKKLIECCISFTLGYK